MQKRGYAADSIRVALRTGDHFARWLGPRGGLSNANETTSAAFIKTLGDPSNLHSPKSAFVLPHIISVLRAKSIVEQLQEPHPETPAQSWLVRFETYRERVLGSVPSTQQRYRPILRQFLDSRFGKAEPDWSTLTADDLTGFLKTQAELRLGFGRNVPAVALRAFLRFLTSEGVVRDGLQRAIPTMRKWRHASLPPTMTGEQIEALLATCSGEHPADLRDRAAILLLARLGVRAGEVAMLSLDDIDWGEARLVIHCGKAHRDRVLPLLADVGQALADYLKLGRPSSTSRKIFLGTRAPFQPFHGTSPVSHIVKRRLSQAGIQVSARYAAHLLRHTLASRIVCSGGSFKEALT